MIEKKKEILVINGFHMCVLYISEKKTIVYDSSFTLTLNAQSLLSP